MAEEAPIDNEILISLVAQNPVLWDKTMEMYKNRVATQAAWKEITTTLNPNLETTEEIARQAYAKLVIQRWTHIRDNYSRSIKKIKDQKRSGNAKTTKPYFYSKQLSFLRKVIKPNETVSNLIAETTESENQESISVKNEGSETNLKKTDDTVTTNSIHKRIAKRPMKNDTNVLDSKMTKFIDSFENQEPKVTNRHLLFFHAIMPSLDDFHDNEVIEFQMEVLQLIKKIKNSRQNTLQPFK